MTRLQLWRGIYLQGVVFFGVFIQALVAGIDHMILDHRQDGGFPPPAGLSTNVTPRHRHGNSRGHFVDPSKNQRRSTVDEADRGLPGQPLPGIPDGSIDQRLLNWDDEPISGPEAILPECQNRTCICKEREILCSQHNTLNHFPIPTQPMYNVTQM